MIKSSSAIWKGGQPGGSRESAGSQPALSRDAAGCWRETAGRLAGDSRGAAGSTTATLLKLRISSVSVLSPSDPQNQPLKSGHPLI